MAMARAEGRASPELSRPPDGQNTQLRGHWALLLGSLGQELVLTGFQLGQLRAKIRERPPANQDQGAQSKAEHPVRVQPPCHAHPNYPPQQHDRLSSVSE